MAVPKPPVSRARMPQHRKGGGRHAAPPRPGPKPSPRARDQSARSSNSARRAQAAAKTSAQTARKGILTTRAGVAHGGQHAVMAEFIVFCVIVAMRAIADYVPSDDGGTSKGKMTPPAGQLGPLPILAGGMVTFFVLSFVAARGGTAAKVAAAGGLIMDLALLLRSTAELSTVSGAFTAVTAPAASPSTSGTPAPSKGPTDSPEGS
jgi:hypothetical protein